MKRGLGLGVIALVSSLASARLARADNGNQQAAQALFEEGRRLMAAEQYADACPKFAESERLDPGAGTLLNLALCYEKNEQFASAWITYTQAIEDADRSGRGEWEKRAREKSAAIQPHLTLITIAVPKNTLRIDGLAITRDGEKINPAAYGVKVPIDGGDHVIEATAPGRQTWTRHVIAPARDGNLTVSVPVLTATDTPAAPVPLTPTPPPETKKPAPSSKFGVQRTVGIAVGALGVIGLGLGGYFTLRAAAKHSDAKKDCNAAETECGPRGLSEYSSAKSAASVATIGVIAGAALIVGGVVLFLTAPNGDTPPTALIDARRGWQF